MNNLKFSVVIPTYNRCNSLRVTLDALARQDFSCDLFEVVVVSDGSTDGTNDLLNILVSRGEYAYTLRPIFQENAGPARARNRGVEESHGSIIIFLDDDVEPSPGYLKSHAQHHARNADIAIIGPMAPDPTRRWSEPCWIGWEHAMLEKQYDNWQKGVWKGVGPNHFYTGNASVAKRHIQAVGGFDETFKRQEDVEMAERMARSEPPVSFAFDREAKGTHRPTRTFASWCAVPTAYGKLDAIRVRRGDVSLDLIQSNYQNRNRVTRAFTDLCVNMPGIKAPIEAVLVLLSQTSWHLRQAKVSLALLSIIYNIRYLLAFTQEFGEGKQVLYYLRGQRLSKIVPTEQK